MNYYKYRDQTFIFLLQTNRLSNDGEKIETLKYVDIVPNKIKKNARNLRMEEWREDGTKVETKSINWNIADVSVNPMMFQFPHILHFLLRSRLIQPIFLAKY